MKPRTRFTEGEAMGRRQSEIAKEVREILYKQVETCWVPNTDSSSDKEIDHYEVENPEELLIDLMIYIDRNFERRQSDKV